MLRVFFKSVLELLRSIGLNITLTIIVLIVQMIAIGYYFGWLAFGITLLFFLLPALLWVFVPNASPAMLVVMYWLIIAVIVGFGSVALYNQIGMWATVTLYSMFLFFGVVVKR